MFRCAAAEGCAARRAAYSVSSETGVHKIFSRLHIVIFGRFFVLYFCSRLMQTGATVILLGLHISIQRLRLGGFCPPICQPDASSTRGAAQLGSQAASSPSERVASLVLSQQGVHFPVQLLPISCAAGCASCRELCSQELSRIERHCDFCSAGCALGVRCVSQGFFVAAVRIWTCSPYVSLCVFGDA